MLTSDKLSDVSDKITELESSKLTIDSCMKLSALYTVRYFNTDNEIYQTKPNTDKVIDELDDILPAYKSYKITKIKYQQSLIPKEELCVSMRTLCKELYEFISILYSSSDIPDERENLLKTLQKSINEIQGGV